MGTVSATEDRTYQIRSGLFDKLAAHFPDEYTHPRGSLIDLIPYSASLSNENSLATQWSEQHCGVPGNSTTLLTRQLDIDLSLNNFEGILDLEDFLDLDDWVD